MTEKKQQGEKQQEEKQQGEKGSMTVEEAGRMGGHKGGQRERELVQKGHEVEEQRGGGAEEQPKKKS
jgi:hypothetical protein